MAGELEQEFTEAELTGAEETAPTAEPTPPGESAEPKPGETAPPAEPVVEKSAEPSTAPAAEKTVPLAALHEERTRRQDLQRRLEALERSRETPATPEDLKALILDNPERAVEILAQQNEDLRARLDGIEIKHSIDKEVPDFLDKAPLMEELLLNEGLGEESVVNLIAASGKDAPKLFRILSKLVDTPDVKKLEADITTRLTSTLTDTITKQLMAKFQISTPARSLNNLPGTTVDGKLNISSETDYDKLTPDQREKWLTGEI